MADGSGADLWPDYDLGELLEGAGFIAQYPIPLEALG